MYFMDVWLYLSSEMAEVAGVVMPALVKAATLYHGVTSHKETPSNPSNDRAKHVTRAASQEQVVLLMSCFTTCFVMIALPVTHFSSILCCFSVLQTFSWMEHYWVPSNWQQACQNRCLLFHQSRNKFVYMRLWMDR
uniref:Uncharacterized protein n=1 Tax=Arundo donax TaxID=35708 RepID=A0A0A9GTD8_ARUDO